MKLESFVGCGKLGEVGMRDGERMPIELEELSRRNRILRRIEVRRIRQQEPQRVANPPVALDHALEDLVRDRQLSRIIGRADPEAKNLGAVGARHLLRRDDVAFGLGHLQPRAVDDKAVRQQRIVGRAAVEHARGQQRRVKPAAMLIRSFEIEIGGKSGVERSRTGAGAPSVGAAHHGLMRGA